MNARNKPGAARLVGVYAILLALLGASLGVASVDLGWLNPVLNLSIAIAKAFLVLWFFMHLKDFGPLVRLFALGALFWLGLLLVLGLGDWLTRPGGY